jgi:hypothetical protein
MSLKRDRAYLAGSENVGASTLITRLFKRFSPSDRTLRKGKHLVMLTGDAAKVLGEQDFTRVNLEDLSSEDLNKLASLFGV